MYKLFSTLAIVAAIGVAAVWVKYDSLNPCDWLLPAAADKAGVPRAMIGPALGLVLPAGVSVAEAKRGFRESPPAQCFRAWVDLQVNGLPTGDY